MTAQEIKALLDAHDALVRECVESRLPFEEFVFAYGDLRVALEEDTRSAVSRLFGKRIAFHKLVAGVVSGLRGAGDLPGMDSGAGRFLPMVGLMRLRELVARYPDFRCGGAEQMQSGGT